MSAAAIIQRAITEGLVVSLSQTGNLKTVGPRKVLNHWRPLLAQHKKEIIHLLSCDSGETVEVARPIPKSATGLPCGRCGSTRYIRVVYGYSFPDGSQVDGWHCRSPTCGVKLLTGNLEVDQKRTRPAPEISDALSR